jgi:hypothetical protein
MYAEDSKVEKRLDLKHQEATGKILRATPYEVDLLLNFGPKPDFRRKAYDNKRKSITWKKNIVSALAHILYIRKQK